MRHAKLRTAVLAVFTISDTANAIYGRYVVALADPSQRISYAAHFAGGIVGVLLGAVVLRNLKVLNWETLAGKLALLTLCALFLGVIIANIAM